MLSSLEREGKIPGSVSTGRKISAKNSRKSSRNKYGIAALFVVLIAGAGAFFALGPFNDSSGALTASTLPPVTAVAVTGRPTPTALAASAAFAATEPASAAAPTASAASAPSTEVARIELAAAGAQSAAPAAAASAALAESEVSSRPHVNPLDKLAMNDTDEPSASAPHPVSQDKSRAKGKNAAKPHAESVAAARLAAARADAKRPVARKSRQPEAEADADTELVAAMIARLDKRGPKPGSAAADVQTEAATANITNRVRRCSSNKDLLEARQCRNKACEGHWGKVDACPAARAPKTSGNDGADRGQHS